MPNLETDTVKQAIKKPSIFLVAGPSGERLIRAESLSAVRKHLFGEIRISKATGDNVADLLGSGGSIEEVNLADTAEAPALTE